MEDSDVTHQTLSINEKQHLVVLEYFRNKSQGNSFVTGKETVVTMRPYRWAYPGVTRLSKWPAARPDTPSQRTYKPWKQYPTSNL